MFHHYSVATNRKIYIHVLLIKFMEKANKQINKQKTSIDSYVPSTIQTQGTKKLLDFRDEYSENVAVGDDFFSEQDYVRALIYYAKASNALEIYAIACPEDEVEEIKDEFDYVTTMLEQTRNVLEDPDFFRKSRLTYRMQKAIDEQKYEVAATLRDKLKVLNSSDLS